MTKQFYLISIGILYTNLVTAQVNQGARLSAMGNSGVAVKDLWGVAVNPAAIISISSPTLNLSYATHFFAKEISQQAIALVIPINRQKIGVNLQRYGISEFQSIQAGVIFTREFGPRLAIGLRANYHQLQISEYGATIGFSADLGICYQLSEELSFGFYITNPSKEKYWSSSIYTTIPTSAYFGIAYQTSKKFLIAMSMSKDTFALGMDYQLISWFSLRTGISLNSFTHYAGFGFSKLQFLVDFSLSRNQNFGYSPQLTIGYVL